MRTPVEEREVVVQFNTDEDIAHVYTSDYTYMTKLDKRVRNNPDEWKLVSVNKQDGDIVGKSYICPKKAVSFRAGSAPKKVMTEQQKEDAKIRMAEARAKKKRGEADAAGN